MKNSGGRYGGAITAGLFLKQFIEKGVTWAHLVRAQRTDPRRTGRTKSPGPRPARFSPRRGRLRRQDIAGPVWDEKSNCATGWGAATLAAWVLEHSSPKK